MQESREHVVKRLYFFNKETKYCNLFILNLCELVMHLYYFQLLCILVCLSIQIFYNCFMSCFLNIFSLQQVLGNLTAVHSYFDLFSRKIEQDDMVCVIIN